MNPGSARARHGHDVLEAEASPPAVCLRDPAGFDVAAFEALVGTDTLGRLRGLVRRLELALRGGTRPVTVWHVNSSAAGGGVADILNFLVPFGDELGVRSRWLVAGGDERFFTVTKTFHNALQGDPAAPISAPMLDHYRQTTRANARALDGLLADRGADPPDVVVVHDPQPAGMIPYWRAALPGALFVWQGHIQFDVGAIAGDHPARTAWRLLADFANQCDAAVFHLPEQVPPGLRVPTRCFLPSINPLGFLNRDLGGADGDRFVDATLHKYGLGALCDRTIPLVAQIARFDPWKDPLGVIEAYRDARARLGPHARPHLLLAGPLAMDDPEAVSVLGAVRRMVDGDPLAHALPLSPGEGRATEAQARELAALGLAADGLRADELLDLEINAFQSRADVIIAKSLKEGFGLATTGAGYHGKPRIVSEVGGLRAQVMDERGRVQACLVGGRPTFTREASIRMTRDWLVALLSRPGLARALGRRARRHVMRAFLPHRHLEDYLRLFLDLAVRRPGLAPAATNGHVTSPPGLAA
jgi:trehalose synthase